MLKETVEVVAYSVSTFGSRDLQPVHPFPSTTLALRPSMELQTVRLLSVPSKMPPYSQKRLLHSSQNRLVRN
jgi:hypothetical protein